MFHDKRRIKRFDVLLNVEIKPSRDASEYLSGITRNFSHEGFSFVSYFFDFEPSESLEIRVRHPQKDSFVHALGDIIWKKQVDDLCFAGIRFRQMDDQAKTEILDYSYDLSLESGG